MIRYLTHCFLIGLSASAALGPVFMLTLHKSMTYGFWHGFAAALGASLGDGIFFVLGLLGVLPFITTSKIAIMVMDIVGGTVLLVMGVSILCKQANFSVSDVYQERIFASMVRSFLLTILNPAVALFFMIVSIKFFRNFAATLPQVITGGLCVSLGSLTMLTTVAFFARSLGLTLHPKRLLVVSWISGLLFIGIGAHFIFDFVKKILT